MKFKFEEILNGKKTYIAAILIVVLGILEGLEILVIPGYLYVVLGGAGLAGLRSPIKLIAKSVKELIELIQEVKKLIQERKDK